MLYLCTVKTHAAMRHGFNLLFLLITLLCTFNFTNAQTTGKVIEQKTIKSAILSRDVNYTIYLPAGYEKSERSYPVVSLLHGFTDDNTGWLQFGEINRYANKAIADGTIGDSFRQK